MTTTAIDHPTLGCTSISASRLLPSTQIITIYYYYSAPTSLNGGQPHFARCLAVSWAGTRYIHFQGLLPPNRILPCAKFTFRPSLAFSYICSITAWHSSIGRGRQPNFAVFSRWHHLYSSGQPSCCALDHILVIITLPKVDIYFIRPQTVEGRVDLGSAVRVCRPCTRLYHSSCHEKYICLQWDSILRSHILQSWPLHISTS